MADYLTVSGTKYPLATFVDVELWELDAVEDETGMTIDEIESLWESPENTKRGRMAVAARVWACRRAAGEVLTVRDAMAGVRLRDIDFVTESAEEVAVDPTKSAPAAGSESSTG